jgi:hypothetical protein
MAARRDQKTQSKSPFTTSTDFRQRSYGGAGAKAKTIGVLAFKPNRQRTQNKRELRTTSAGC